jgi:hypothetical protein
MPVSAGMHESGPRRPGEGIRTITLHNFPRTAVGLRRGDELPTWYCCNYFTTDIAFSWAISSSP